MEKKHNPFTMHVNVDDFLPATEEEKARKAEVMAVVLKDACEVPMEIMRCCGGCR